MKSYTFLPVLLVLIVLSVPAAAQVDGGVSKCDLKRVQDRTEHEPISITGDLAAAAAALLKTQGIRSGTGTQSDPIVISDWHIFGTAAAAAVVIADVDLHIRLERLTLGPGQLGISLVIVDSSNVTIASTDAAGAVGIEDASVVATKLGLYGATVEVWTSSVQGSDLTHVSSSDLGEPVWKIVSSSFDLAFVSIDHCREQGFFGVETGGRTRGLQRLALPSSPEMQLSIWPHMGGPFTLEADGKIDFLQTGTSGGDPEYSTFRSSPDALRQGRMAELGDISFDAENSTITIQNARLGGVWLSDSVPTASIILDRSVLTLLDNVSPRSKVVVECGSSDVHDDGGPVIYPLEIHGDDCYVASALLKYVRAGTSLRKTPHFGPAEESSSEDAPAVAAGLLLLTGTVMGALLRRCGREGA